MTSTQAASSAASAAKTVTTDYKQQPISKVFDQMSTNVLAHPGTFDAIQATNMVLNHVGAAESQSPNYDRPSLESTMSGQVDFSAVDKADFVYTAIKFIQMDDAKESPNRTKAEDQLKQYLNSQRFYQVLNMLLGGASKVVAERSVPKAPTRPPLPVDVSSPPMPPASARAGGVSLAQTGAVNNAQFANDNSAETQVARLGLQIDERDKDVNVEKSGRRPSVYEQLSEAQRTLVRHKFAQLKKTGKNPSKSALARITQEVGNRDAEPSGTSLSKLIEQFQFADEDFTKSSAPRTSKPDSPARIGAVDLAAPAQSTEPSSENDFDAKLALFDQGKIKFKVLMREIAEYLDIELPKSSSHSANTVMTFLADDFDPALAVGDIAEYGKLRLIATAIKSDPEAAYGEILREEGGFSKLIDNLSQI